MATQKFSLLLTKEQISIIIILYEKMAAESALFDGRGCKYEMKEEMYYANYKVIGTKCVEVR